MLTIDGGWMIWSWA